MLKSSMQKKLNIFILVLFFTQSLVAKEPLMALLMNVQSNDVQQFKINNYKLNCSAYGVLSIDELYRKSGFDSKCKESIKGFYEKRAELKYYTSSKLNVMQSYSIELKNDNKCIVYASGGKTLSEFLLENGLAVLKPLFKDEEFKYYFNKSQQNAKMKRKGIWQDNITKECISDIYKK